MAKKKKSSWDIESVEDSDAPEAKPEAEEVKKKAASDISEHSKFDKFKKGSK